MYEIGLMRDDGTAVTRRVSASNAVEAISSLVELLTENFLDFDAIRAAGVRRIDESRT